jgi:hypothetical protein
MMTVIRSLKEKEDLDDIKSPGSNGVLVLESYACFFAVSLSMILNRSLVTSVFSDGWKFSFVTPIFKSGRRNNVADYREVF